MAVHAARSGHGRLGRGDPTLMQVPETIFFRSWVLLNLLGRVSDLASHIM